MQPPVSPAPQAPRPAASWMLEDSQLTSFQRLAFYSAVGLLFLRLSVIPELVFSFTGVNTYLLYIFAPSAILGAIATGAIPRTLRSRAAWMWLGFFLWMILATPLSSWVGGSLQRVMNYGRVDFVFLFILGGLILTWSQVRTVLAAVAIACMINVLTGRFLGVSDMGGRTNLTDMVGSIGNSNDLAAHLLLVLPFAGYMLMDSRRNMLVRLIFAGVLGLGLVVVLGTGSRGAVLGLAMASLVFLWKSTGAQRTTVLACIGVLAVVAPLTLPASTLARIKSLVGEEHVEAEESGRSREYLFKKSLEFTAQHPIFGVGPDQFANFEGKQRIEAGLIGNWHATHCAWTQVSSECGIPALLLFAGGLFTSIGMVWRTNRRAKLSGFHDIRNATLCFLTGMVAHLTAITFLSNAYAYYLPALVGFAIAMTTVANRYMDQSLARNAAAPAFPAPKLAAF